MKNIFNSIKNRVSKLTKLSWVLIVILASGLVVGGVLYLGGDENQTKTVKPTGKGPLPDNLADLPPVKEGEDATGEILPNSTPAQTEPADIKTPEEALAFPEE